MISDGRGSNARKGAVFASTRDLVNAHGRKGWLGSGAFEAAIDGQGLVGRRWIRSNGSTLVPDSRLVRSALVPAQQHVARRGVPRRARYRTRLSLFHRPDSVCQWPVASEAPDRSTHPP